MMLAKCLAPWEVLEVDLHKIPNTSEAENEYYLLLVKEDLQIPLRLPATVKGSTRSSPPASRSLLEIGLPPVTRADRG